MQERFTEYDPVLLEQLNLRDTEEDADSAAERTQRWISILVLASALALALVALVRLF